MVQADATGRMALVNQRWCEMLGYSEAELLTMTIADVTDPALLAPTREAVRRLAEGGPDFVLEKRYRRKDGSLLWASSSVNGLRNPAGEYLGLVAVVLDITERKRTEEALQKREEDFRTLADNMSQFAWMADAKGWIFWYNRRWYDYTGTTLEEMQGWGWKKVHHPDHVDRVIERLTRGWPTSNG